MRIILYFLEAWFKINLFRPLLRYRIIEIKTQKIERAFHSRVQITLEDTNSGKVYGGMAEGRTLTDAHLRALAEAYEKICVQDFEARLGLLTDRSLPYGVGVGMRKRRAILRAQAEYWERETFLVKNALPPQNLRRVTGFGSIYISAVAGDNGLVGTGYGTTEACARDSAAKSLIRKNDFSIANPVFTDPQKRTPQIYRLTPVTQPWLECYYVGFIKTAVARD